MKKNIENIKSGIIELDLWNDEINFLIYSYPSNQYMIGYNNYEVTFDGKLYECDFSQVCEGATL